MRFAGLMTDSPIHVIAKYLPENYNCHGFDMGNGYSFVLIYGTDEAGWTLDGYVIPRLNSGNYYPKEIHV